MVGNKRLRKFLVEYLLDKESERSDTLAAEASKKPALGSTKQGVLSILHDKSVFKPIEVIQLRNRRSITVFTLIPGYNPNKDPLICKHKPEDNFKVRTS